jgi:hypothetical protein
MKSYTATPHPTRDGKMGSGGGWLPTPRCCKATVHAEDADRPLSGRHGDSLPQEPGPGFAPSFPQLEGVSAATTNTTPPGPSHHATLRVSRDGVPGRELRRHNKIGKNPVGRRRRSSIPLKNAGDASNLGYESHLPHSDANSTHGSPCSARLSASSKHPDSKALDYCCARQHCLDSRYGHGHRLGGGSGLTPPSPSPPPTVPKHAPLLLMPPSPPPSPSHPSATLALVAQLGRPGPAASQDMTAAVGL